MNRIGRVFATFAVTCVTSEAQYRWDEVSMPDGGDAEPASLVAWDGGVRLFYDRNDFPQEPGTCYRDSADGRIWTDLFCGSVAELDATSRLANILNGRSFFQDPVTDFLAGGDPSPDQQKTLEVVYTSPLGLRRALVPEGQWLDVPSPGHELLDAGTTSPTIAVVSARYFAEGNLPIRRVVDATSFLGSEVWIGEGASSSRAALGIFDGTDLEVEDSGFWGYESELVRVVTGNGTCVIASLDDDYSLTQESELHWTDDLENWNQAELAPISQRQLIRDLRFEDEKFICVGEYVEEYSSRADGSFIGHSVDGRDWTVWLLPGFEGLQSVAFSDTAWCAVGMDGLVLSSTDGSFWTLAPNSGEDFVQVVHAGGQWVAAREGGGIFTSTDLVTWTQRSGEAGPWLIPVTNGLVAGNSNRLWASSLAAPGAPSVSQQPQDAVILPGQTQLLEVVADGQATLTYQWYEGERGDTGSPVPGAVTASMTTPALSESGSYWVRVSNAIDYDDSLTAVVTVAVMPTVTTPPQGGHYLMGDSPTLSVTATGGGLGYQWYEGSSGDTSQPMAGANGASFRPPDEMPGEFQYWVRVSNLAGNTDSGTAVLEILPVPPVITSQDLAETVAAYDYAYFFISSYGVGRTYAWYWGESGDTSQPIAGQGDNRSGFSPDTDNAGVFSFWVRVSNAASHVDSETMVLTVVPAPPVIYDSSGDHVGSPGNSVRLSVSVRPFDDREYQWYAGMSGDISQPIAQTSSSYYPDTSLAGVRNYWVRASNPFGSVDSRTFTVRLNPRTFTEWALGNGLPDDGSGDGAPDATPAGDGIENVQRYVLGRHLGDDGTWQLAPQWSTHEVTGERHAAVWVRSLEGITDFQVEVEESQNLATWDATAHETGRVIRHPDGTISREFITSQPASATSVFFLRARIVGPL